MKIPPLKKSGGVALITVLLVVASATIAAVAISSRLQVDIRRTENLLHADQAWLHALGIESWAQGVLAADARETGTDHLGEAWNKPLESTPVEGGSVAGKIVDQQGLFNLNNLLDKDLKPSDLGLERFRRLLKILELDPLLANALLDWMDKDSEPQPEGGAEDGDYQGRAPAYVSANRRLVHPSELLLVKGFTPEVYGLVAPYVCALPEPVDININTAPVPVLMSLVEGLTEQDAQRLADDIEASPFEEISEFMQHDAIAGLKIPAKRHGLGLKSDYFKIRGRVRVGKAQVGISSLLHRAEGEGVKIILRMREDIFSG